jgi:hypothetical protein
METAPSPQFCTIADWLAISGLSRRVTYDRLGTGELKSIKLGTRTLIDCEAGLAWLRSLPPAQIRPPRPRKAA